MNKFNRSNLERNGFQRVAAFLYFASVCYTYLILPIFHTLSSGHRKPYVWKEIAAIICNRVEFKNDNIL